ncbi:MAG TPA: hypothetical protein VGF67_02740 [Ktedonobacteraceae bacterium]
MTSTIFTRFSFSFTSPEAETALPTRDGWAPCIWVRITTRVGRRLRGERSTAWLPAALCSDREFAGPAGVNRAVTVSPREEGQLLAGFQDRRQYG